MESMARLRNSMCLGKVLPGSWAPVPCPTEGQLLLPTSPRLQYSIARVKLPLLMVARER